MEMLIANIYHFQSIIRNRLRGKDQDAKPGTKLPGQFDQKCYVAKGHGMSRNATDDVPFG